MIVETVVTLAIQVTVEIAAEEIAAEEIAENNLIYGRIIRK
jgi:hypothetical protein